MPFNNIGYRGWSGKKESDLTRWCIITSTGVIRAWQSRWLRRLLITIWFPAAFFGLAFFSWEQAATNPELIGRRGPMRAVVNQMTSRLGENLVSLDRPDESRPFVWAWLLSSFYRYPQLVVMVLMVGMIAPPLISQDIRSRAFLLYFSRPLNRFEYVLGKQATLWSFLALISIVPGLAMYATGVLLSPSLDVLTATWDLPLKVLGASVLMMIPTGSLALCFSALTQQSRYAGFAWFAIWVVGWTTYAIMRSVYSDQLAPNEKPPESWWTLASPYHVLDRAQSWVFGLTDFSDAKYSIAMLVCITIVANVLIFRRVAAPMRA